MRVVALALVALLAGCGYRGPESIRATRPAYNQAIQQTNDQELLLNIVRLRYRDTPYFTTVERIAATHELNQTYGFGGTLTSTHQTPVNPPASNTMVGDILTGTLSMGSNSIALNEKPTVFYAPLEGERFVRQMLTPLNPDLLLMLVRSGWSIDRVFSVAVLEMNGLNNAPSASGPAPSHMPDFEHFREAVLLMRSLQRQGKLDLVKASAGDGIDLVFLSGAGQGAEGLALKKLLRLELTAERFRILNGSEYRDGRSVVVSTRSMVAALHYLSTGVEVPEQDLDQGRVRRTVREDGTAFDWQDMLEGVFRVQSSPSEPLNNALSVPYRGTWFYIADNDLDSKSTFVLLTQLIALHSVPASSSLPMTFSFGK